MQHEQPEQVDTPINPYSDGGYERVDISKLSNAAPTINMNTPQLQYIPSQQVPQYTFDGSPVQISMNAPQPAAAPSYQYAGSAPAFTPTVPVVSAQPPQQPEEEQPAEEAPSAKRVEVTKKVRQVPAGEKVRITVRHGR